MLWYSALKAKIVVIVPAPAINGKAIGTIEAVFGASSLYSRTPRIISKAKKKSTKAPATANELTSIPISFRILSPTNKKAAIIKKATIDAFSDWMCPIRVRKSTIIGMLPKISITANKIIVAVKVSFQSNSKKKSIFCLKNPDTKI